MRFSNDNTTWSAWEKYAFIKNNWTLATGNGTKTVYVKFKDLAGNESEVYSDTIILDTAAPSGTVEINNDSVYATSASVTLAISATDKLSGMAQMCFSNSNSSYSAWEPYAAAKSWTLTSGNGIKTVYVKFKDLAGNESVVCSDTIILDAAPPPRLVKINGDSVYANSTSVTLNLSVQDLGSGMGPVAQMQFSNDGYTYSAFEPYAITKSWTLTLGSGTKTVYAIFKDTMGKTSKIYADSIILDTTQPAGSISINGNAYSTNSTLVTLTLEAHDSNGITQMCFSNDLVAWSSPEAYATTKSWTLTPGSGTKTVYVKFKDVAGNWSTIYPDTIYLN
jgi:hypothetical protein